MKDKLIKFLTNNIGLKILALILAVILWTVVVSVDNPVEKRNFTAAITLENQDTLSSQGKYVSVADSSLSVNFKVRAKRSIMDRLSNSDFIATADLAYIDEDGNVPIRISCTSYPSTVFILGATHYLKVEVGEKRANKFVIKGETSGEPAEGYDVDDISVEPNVVSVEGPENVVSKIASVVAIADVDGLGANINENVVPKFYDKKGKEVNTTKLRLSVTTVKVRVTMASVKKVPIEVHLPEKSILDGDVDIQEITTDPKELSVRGNARDLNKLSKISIPFSALNLNDITKDTTTTVDVTSFLPEGVSIAGTRGAKVEIYIDVRTIEERHFAIPVENLNIQNLPEGMKAEFKGKTVSVTIKGYDDQLNSLSADEITGSVDASGLTAGKHKVDVVLNLDDDLSAGSATAVIVLSENEPDQQEDNNE
ncbi:MAG: CdaR family protein [Candidatus Weimeria sp.]|nr:CdaR family protein [Candidatus Weimeria sp.]